jgi:uncharacterized iron-regulated membrane protein
MGFLDHPQRLWWRKVIFQIHLWVGIVLCLYVSVIGLSGSLLVVRGEIERASFHLLMVRSDQAPVSVSFAEVVDAVKEKYPELKLSYGLMPRLPDENAVLFATEKQSDESRYVFVSPSSGNIVGDLKPDKFWLSYVGQIHYFLLMGNTGLIVNGVGAAFLMLLTLSGLVLWWPGIRNWKRGFGISLKRSWRRINFDLHSVVGFWTLSLLLIWSVSSVYFAWPRQMERWMNTVSSTASLKPPRYTVRPTIEGPLPLARLMEQGPKASPNGLIAGAFLTNGATEPLTVLMARHQKIDFLDMDYVYVDPYRGNTLGIWHRGVNPTWGSKALFLLAPLHFGSSWGVVVKILWFLFGLSLPLLSITGVLMYWNRVLRKKWKLLQARRA